MGGFAIEIGRGNHYGTLSQIAGVTCLAPLQAAYMMPGPPPMMTV